MAESQTVRAAFEGLLDAFEAAVQTQIDKIEEKVAEKRVNQLAEDLETLKQRNENPE